MMNYLKAIENKNSGIEYTRSDLEAFILSYTKNEIDDELMTKFIKSIFDNGMETRALSEMTEIMMHSGETIDLSQIKGIKVDKHSTGGVGDKITIIIAPIVASLGAPIAKMSGRGLGFTGGTLDKLESIPGYNISLSEEEFIQNVKKHNIAVIGQTKELVPADKRIYALRDETGYIDSIPLIASSIMSKKLATGSDAILLDVKCGDAAFMKNQNDAEKLAISMINLGKSLGKDVRAEITSMDNPLGRAIGNKHEILESYEALKGNWTNDLKAVVYSSAKTMLVQSKLFDDEEKAEKAIDDSISSGKAFEKFKEWIISQGGNFNAIEEENFISNKFHHEIKADKDGFMNITSAVKFGIAAMELGAGRKKKEDDIDHNAGIYLNKKTGEKVTKGDTLFTLHSNIEINNSILNPLFDAFEIIDIKKEPKVILNKL